MQQFVLEFGDATINRNNTNVGSNYYEDESVGKMIIDVMEDPRALNFATESVTLFRHGVKNFHARRNTIFIQPCLKTHFDFNLVFDSRILC
jgi:hypothetical protein